MRDQASRAGRADRESDSGAYETGAARAGDAEVFAMIEEIDVPAFCPCCGHEGWLPLIWPEGRHINVETGIAPIAEWGPSARRGFVSDSRFGSGQVIKRSNRNVSRKWRRVASG